MIRRLSPVGRDDVLSVTAWGRNQEARAVDVTLHVVFGMVQELEVWAGWDGGEVATEAARDGDDATRVTAQAMSGANGAVWEESTE